MKTNILFGNGFMFAMHMALIASLLLVISFARAEEGQVCAATAGISWLGNPVMDGVVERFPVPTSVDPSGFKSDPRWNGAAKINLSYSNEAGTGTGAIPGKLLVGDTTDALYMGIVIQLDTSPYVTPSENDIVVLALSTDSNPLHDWRIHIYPFTAAQVSQDYEGSNPDIVQAWRNSSDSNSGWNVDPNANEITPAWLNPASGNIKIAKSNKFWSLEMKIPKSTIENNGINLPSGTNAFRLYANVISANSLQASFVQDPWPLWSQAAIRQVSTPPFSIDYHTPPKDKQNSVSAIQVSSGIATATSNGHSFKVGEQVTISGLSGYSGSYVITSVTPTTFSFAAPSGAFAVTGSGTAKVLVWGTASLAQRAECTGISIAQSNIGVLNNNVIENLIHVYKPSATNPSEAYPPGVGQTASAQCQTLFNNNINLQGLMGPNNTFVARTTNSSSHTPSELEVTFRLSQFGISSAEQFKAIGPSVITPPAPVNVPPAGTPASPGQGETRQLKQFNWLESCQYMVGNFYNGRPHNCLLVELDSKDPNTRFLNRSVWTNMDFTTASKMEHMATINAKGFGKPAKGMKHEFLVHVNSELQSFKPGISVNPGTSANRLDVTKSTDAAGPTQNSQAKNWMSFGSEEIIKEIPVQYPKGISEAMLWTAYGYLLNGNYLEIRSKRFREAQFVGGFGYVVGHSGDVTGWSKELKNSDLKEPRLEKVDGSTYSINISPEASVSLVTSIDAKEPTQCVNTGCSPCENIKIGSSDGPELPGALVLIGFIGGLGGFVFRKRRKGDKGQVV